MEAVRRRQSPPPTVTWTRSIMFLPNEPLSILNYMKPYYVFSLRRRVDPRLQHSSRIESFTSRLRVAHVSREPRQNRCAQSALWRSHRRDLQTAQHEEHRLLVTGRCAEFAKSIHLHFRASQPARGGEELGCLPSRSRMEKGEDRIGSKRATGGSYRPLLHGSDQLFGAELTGVELLRLRK